MSYDSHIKSAEQIIARCAVITLSDTRTEQTDTSGAAIQRLLRDAAHQIAFYRIIRDEAADLSALLDVLLSRRDVDLILTSGGTGISPRDQTIPVIEKLIEQPLSGFGELFRMLSFHEIASGAMLTRAVAGIARGKPIFAMPGSTKAVELAMTKLIIPEIGHLLHQLRAPTV